MTNRNQTRRNGINNPFHVPLNKEKKETLNLDLNSNLNSNSDYLAQNRLQNYVKYFRTSKPDVSN